MKTKRLHFELCENNTIYKGMSCTLGSSLKRSFYSMLIAMVLAAFLTNKSYALHGATGIHDPSSIIKRNGVYHVWGTGNQIYHLTSTDLINWTVASTVFPSGTWPSWINTYVSGFAGNFWAPECVYMNGKYYMYYACSTGGRPCAIGVATSTDLTNWTDQGVVIYSTSSSTYGSIDPAIFSDASGNYWMTFGSHLTGIWIAQLNTSTGKRLNSTLKNIAGTSNCDYEASYVIRNGSYYYLFYNRGICCAGSSSTYYVQMGRSTSPTGPYVGQSGTALLSGGGTTVLSGSGNYVGPGCVGFYQENGYNFLTHHYYDSNNNGAPTLCVGNLGWNSGWPFITRDWVAAGTYKITNKNSGLVWDSWGCTGASLQSIAQGVSNGLTCQQWVFNTLGNGNYKINCALGGLTAEVYNCSAANSAPLDLYSYWGGTCQQFKLERAGDGSLVFSSLNGNRVVEVPNASVTAGVQLALWDYNGNNCQKWIVGTPGARLASINDENIAPDGLGIYPNPSSSGVFTIDLQGFDSDVCVNVSDVKGASLFNKTYNYSEKILVESHLQPGLYFVEVKSKGKITTQKLLIQ